MNRRSEGSTIIEELLARLYCEHKKDDKTFPSISDGGQLVPVVCSASRDLNTGKLVQIFTGPDQDIIISLISTISK